MPQTTANFNLREIPDLDDRLVRYLEYLAGQINQLLEFHVQNRNGIKKTASSIPGVDQIRSALEVTGGAPLNVEGLRGQLGESQPSNVKSYPSLPSLADNTFDDGELVSVLGVVYRRNRTTEPGSWDSITSPTAALYSNMAKVIAGAPYANDGYIVIQDGGGVTRRIMTTA